MFQGTKIYSIFTGTCPKCQQESMYKTSNPYVLRDVLTMYSHCAHCKFRYRLEPAFFYGSMYVSYGVGVAFATAAFVITHLFLGLTLTAAFIAIVITLIAFGPIIMRLSRNIWINMFVNYNKELAEKGKQD